MPSRLEMLTRILLAVVLSLSVALAETAMAGDWGPRISDLGQPANDIENEQEGDDRNDDSLVDRSSSASENERLVRNLGRARLRPTGDHSPAVFRPPE